MRLAFFGAASQVTGSKHLLEVSGKRVLLDCGLYQGPRKVAEQRNRRLPFEPRSLDAVVVSHAHVDHIGLLPLLVKQGYRGPIFATPATADIAGPVLHDSAKIQEEEAEHHNDTAGPGEDPVAPLYLPEDVDRVLGQFVPVPYVRHRPGWREVLPGVRLKFYDAGHILGSAVTVLEAREGGQTRRVGYTGDLGRAQPVLIHQREYISEEVGTLVSEATYGDHNHRDPEAVAHEFEDYVRWAYQNQSKVIIPAFSLGRTQEVVYALHRLVDAGKVPRMPVYLDSPLALSLTEVFEKYSEDFNGRSWQDFSEPYEWPLVFRDLHYVRTREDSAHLQRLRGPCIVVAASGMAEGGRVLWHLKHGLEDPSTLILFTGYQGEHTLGRQILEGKPRVWVLGEDYAVRARVGRLHEFSAHADQGELLNYVGATKGLKRLFLVHTESPQAHAFQNAVKARYPNLTVDIPTLGQRFDV